MPKACYLSMDERKLIDSYINKGKSISWIGRTLKRHKTTISKYIRHPSTYGTSIKQARKPIVLTTRRKRTIKRLIKKHKMSSRLVSNELDNGVSKSTICNFLKTENFRYHKMKRIPKLTALHMKKREQFAEEIISKGKDFVKKLVFSDEKRFKLDGPDGCTYYWHDLKDERSTFSKSHFSAGITLWGCIFSDGKIKVQFLDNTLNSHNYQKVLQETLLPSFVKSKHVFQQDNATCHVSKSTKQWIKTKKIHLIDWPALSCDLNIIENVWGILTNKIYQNGKNFSNIETLKTAILKEVSQFDKGTIKALYDSFYVRCLKVYKRNGNFL